MTRISAEFVCASTASGALERQRCSPPPPHSATLPDERRSSVERQTRETSIRVVQPFARPLERILVRYSRAPADFASIVRLEKASDEFTIREIVAHNALAKYLSCRYVGNSDGGGEQASRVALKVVDMIRR